MPLLRAICRLEWLALKCDMYRVYVFTLPDADLRFTAGPSPEGLKTKGLC
jgi:hypothetical protein